MSSSPVAVGSVGLPLGSTAIDFQLKGVDGKTHSLKSFADKKALAIVFSCNHCPYVQAYEARMVQLQRDYLPKGASLVATEPFAPRRSEEHTSELQSLTNLVCRLLLEQTTATASSQPAAAR